MKRLSPEEVANLHPIKGGRHTWLHKELHMIELGAGLIIHNKDWNGKRPPYEVIRRVAKKLSRKFEYGRLPDGTGWLVKRIA